MTGLPDFISPFQERLIRTSGTLIPSQIFAFCAREEMPVGLRGRSQGGKELQRWRPCAKSLKVGRRDPALRNLLFLTLLLIAASTSLQQRLPVRPGGSG